ncbi:MAG TPA: zf-HC2 domain-containing protein [Tepidisphaeraceae bacterium]|nr:zf-HC2 domain-containing protein [Tepidisphaeraceae bacterium]
MDSSKEIIEAQLAAYVDGDLSDTERAEIERHLDAHPQHRALIAELMGHRDLVRTLPRATAPADMNEALTGHLERSALLDGETESSPAVAGRIHRWPQIAAVAAVALLALSLGIVVYYVLPPAGPQANNLAVNEPGADKRAKDAKFADKDGVKKEMADADRNAGRELRKGGLFGGTSGGDAAARLADGEAAMRQGNLAAGGVAGANLAEAAKQPALAPDVLANANLVAGRDIEALRKSLARDAAGERAGTASRGRAMFLYVSAADTGAANERLTAYFKANHIEPVVVDRLAERATIVGAGGPADASAFGGGVSGSGSASGLGGESAQVGGTSKPLGDVAGPLAAAMDKPAGNGGAVRGGTVNQKFDEARTEPQAGRSDGGRSAPAKPEAVAVRAAPIARSAPAQTGGGAGGYAGASAGPTGAASANQGAQTNGHDNGVDSPDRRVVTAAAARPDTRVPAAPAAVAQADAAKTAGTDWVAPEGLAADKALTEAGAKRGTELARSDPDRTVDDSYYKRAEVGGPVLRVRMPRRQAVELSESLAREAGYRTQVESLDADLDAAVALKPDARELQAAKPQSAAALGAPAEAYGRAPAEGGASKAKQSDGTAESEKLNVAEELKNDDQRRRMTAGSPRPDALRGATAAAPTPPAVPAPTNTSPAPAAGTDDAPKAPAAADAPAGTDAANATGSGARDATASRGKGTRAALIPDPLSRETADDLVDVYVVVRPITVEPAATEAPAAAQSEKK